MALFHCRSEMAYAEYGSLIGVYCTLVTPWSYTVGSAAFIRFKTDGSQAFRGFRLHWRITLSLTIHDFSFQNVLGFNYID